jgi:large subunit ribosomal protein L29
MNTKELRELTSEKLEEQLIKERHELFNLRIQKTTSQLNQTHKFKVLKRNIARIKTLQNETEQ